MTDTSMTKRRWYDQDKRVSAAVETLLKMPDEIQNIVCRAVILLADREFQASELLKNFKSLGTEKILALYKSKERKRTYDHKPETHTTLNYMGFLSEENQQFMATSILEMMSLVQDYLKVCKGQQANPQVRHLESITDTYVDKGMTKARSLLKTFEEELLYKVNQKTVIPAPGNVSVKENEDEMYVHFENK